RSGEKRASYSYDAFGNLFSHMAAPYNAVGFTGKSYDAKAGLVDFGARWYSPNEGRFTTMDTFAGWSNQPLTLNRYSYVHNNPVNFTDPSGHCETTSDSDDTYCIPKPKPPAGGGNGGSTPPPPAPKPGSGGSGGSGGGTGGSGGSGGGGSSGGSEDPVEEPVDPGPTKEELLAMAIAEFNNRAGNIPSNMYKPTKHKYSVYDGYNMHFDSKRKVLGGINQPDLSWGHVTASTVNYWFMEDIHTLLNYRSASKEDVFLAAAGLLYKPGKVVDLAKASKGISKGEQVLDKVKTYEQARNKALDLVGDLGPNSKPYTGTLKSSAGYGKVVGRQSADGKVRWRLDYDPNKGTHINIEDFRNGKGANARKIVIPFEGNENTFKSLLKHLDR
ncbi:RHS repeat-associated core domain-containing protein, partial [Bacillus canaveralius]